jgi:hypothetical protein
MAMRFNPPSFNQMTALVHFVIESNGIYSRRVQEDDDPGAALVQSRNGVRPTVSTAGNAQQWAT